MSGKRTMIGGAVVVAAVLLAVGGYAMFRSSGDGLRVVGDDPRIIVNDERPGSARPAIAARGLLIYDADTGCLLIEHEDMSPQVVIWPKGTKPVKEGDRRGVRVSGTTVLAGDRILANGTPHGRSGNELPACRTEYTTVIFGSVEVDRSD